MKKWFLGFIGILFAACSIAAEPVAGRDFTPVKPFQPGPNGKIEVIEFFSYGCPHCRDFNPVLHQWAERQSGDVVLRRVPVSFGRGAWARMAQVYYALEAGGNIAKLDEAAFKAIQDERANLSTDDAAEAWAASKGIDGKKFVATMNSFSVRSQVQRGDQESNAYRIPGVPALVVDGRFLVASAQSHEQMLSIVDGLIAKIRKERGK